MVPWLTEIVTGATGEMSSPSSAGDALTAATGGGATVVDGELPLAADSDAPAAVLAGPSPPVVCTAANPDDEPEQAALTASTPATTTAMPIRRTAFRTPQLHLVLRSISGRARPIRGDAVKDVWVRRTLPPRQP